MYDLKSFTRKYAATDDTYLSTLKAYTSDTTTLTPTGAGFNILFGPSNALRAMNVTITATVNMSARTFSVVGTRWDGRTVTETITGPTAGGTVAGNVAFKQVTNVLSTGGPTDAVAFGVGKTFVVEPTRIRGIFFTPGITAGDIITRDTGSATGEVKMHIPSPAMATGQPVNVNLSPNGVRHEGGTHLTFSGTNAVTIFYG